MPNQQSKHSQVCCQSLHSPIVALYLPSYRAQPPQVVEESSDLQRSSSSKKHVEEQPLTTSVVFDSPIHRLVERGEMKSIAAMAIQINTVRFSTNIEQ